MVSTVLFALHLLLALHGVVGVESNPQTLADVGPATIDAAGFRTVVARQGDQDHLERYCLDPGVGRFHRTLGKLAVKTFCHGLHGTDETPWRLEKGPVTLNISKSWFSTTYHWIEDGGDWIEDGGDYIFDLRVDVRDPKRLDAVSNLSFGDAKNKWDCLTTLALLVESCCNSDGECMGGVIESPGNFRYKIEHRSADQFRRPPSWTATYKCNFPGPRNTLNNDVVLFAITKFCGQKHVKLGGDSGRPNFDHSQIQDWAVGFSEVEMKFSTFPRTWDGTCKAPLDLKEKKHEK